MLTVRSAGGRGAKPALSAPAPTIGLDDLPELVRRSEDRLWIDLYRPSAAELERVAATLEVPLASLQLLRVEPVPRLLVRETHVLLAVHPVEGESVAEGVRTVSVGLVFNERFLLALHDAPHPAFDEVLTRLDTDQRMLAGGVDRIVHELLDAFARQYAPAVTAIDGRTRGLENAVLTLPGPDPLPRLLALRAEVAALERVILPELDIARQLSTRSVPFVEAQTALYFRDVLDRLTATEAAIAALRSEQTDLVQIHLAVASYRLNESIRILTVFAAVLIPLQLVTGIYSMRFQNMPELRWALGYPFALLLMTVIATGLVLYFKRRALM